MDCWPLDRVLKKATLNDIVEKLKQFKFTPKVTNCESGVCQHDFNRSVTTAISRAKCDFDGLCLDCMTRSKLVTGRPKQEFVEKNSPFKGCWDMGCRFGHGRETWSMWPPSAYTQHTVKLINREQSSRGWDLSLSVKIFSRKILMRSGACRLPTLRGLNLLGISESSFMRRQTQVTESMEIV